MQCLRRFLLRLLALHPQLVPQTPDCTKRNNAHCLQCAHFLAGRFPAWAERFWRASLQLPPGTHDLAPAPQPSDRRQKRIDTLTPLDKGAAALSPLQEGNGTAAATLLEGASHALRAMPEHVACALSEYLPRSEALAAPATVTERVMLCPDLAPVSSAAAAACDAGACACSADKRGLLAVRLEAPACVIERICAALPRARSVTALSLDLSCRSLSEACKALPQWQAFAAALDQCDGVCVALARLHLPPQLAYKLSSADAALREQLWREAAGLLAAVAPTLEHVSLVSRHDPPRPEDGSLQCAWPRLRCLHLQASGYGWLQGNVCRAEALTALQELTVSLVSVGAVDEGLHEREWEHWQQLLPQLGALTRLCIGMGHGPSRSFFRGTDAIGQLGLTRLQGLRSFVMAAPPSTFSFAALTALTQLQQLAVHDVKVAGEWMAEAPQHCSYGLHWDSRDSADPSADDWHTTGWRAFVQSLPAWRRLRHLQLTHCDVDGRQTAILASSIARGALADLVTLDVRQNRSVRFTGRNDGDYRCAGMRIELLAPTLPHCPALQSLDVGLNNWRGSAHSALASALPHLSALSWLALDGAKPEEAEQDGLLDALCSHTALRGVVWPELAAHDDIREKLCFDVLLRRLQSVLRVRTDDSIITRPTTCSFERDWDDMATAENSSDS